MHELCVCLHGREVQCGASDVVDCAHVGAAFEQRAQRIHAPRMRRHVQRQAVGGAACALECGEGGGGVGERVECALQTGGVGEHGVTQQRRTPTLAEQRVRHLAQRLQRVRCIRH